MIKYVLYFLLALESVLLLAGIYYEYIDARHRADFFLGSFTLILFLVLIPVFLYWRLKDKDFSRYHMRKKDS